MKYIYLILFFCIEISSFAQITIETGEKLEAIADANAQKSYFHVKAYAGYLAAYRIYSKEGKKAKQYLILNKTYNLIQQEKFLQNSAQLVIDTLVREAECDFGDDTKKYLPLLESYICKTNSTVDRYTGAFELYDKAVNLRRKQKMLYGLEYEKILRWYTSHMSFKKNITKEEKYEAYSHLWQIFNENHKDSIDIKLVDNCYSVCGLLKSNHEETKVKFSEIKRKYIINSFGKSSQEYLKILNQLVFCYRELAEKNEKIGGNNDARQKSILYQREYWEILNNNDDIYDNKASLFFSIYQNDILAYTKDSLLARTLINDYAKKIEKKKGHQSEEYIEALSMLAKTYQYLDIHQIPILKEKLKLEEDVYGKDDFRTKATSSTLQLIYYNTHRMDAAIDLAIPNEKLLTSSLSNEECMLLLSKASMLTQYGKLREANELYDKLLHIGVSNSYVKAMTFISATLGSISNFNTLRDLSGMLDFARKWCYNKALTTEERKDIFLAVVGLASMPGFSNNDVLQFVDKYADTNTQFAGDVNFQMLIMEARTCVFLGLQRFDDAASVLDRILDICKKENNLNLIIKFSAYKEICYMAKGDYEHALEMNRAVLDMIKNVPGYENKTEYCSACCRACWYYDQLGEYESMTPLLKKIINLQSTDKTYINSLSPFEINSYVASCTWLDLNSIITPYIHNLIFYGNCQEAFSVIKKYIKELYETILFSLSQPDPTIAIGKYGYMKAASDNLNLVASLIPKDKDLAKLVFDYSLLYKQSFLTVETQLRQQIFNSSDSLLLEKFGEMQRLHNAMQHNKQLGLNTDGLSEQIIQIEKQIREDVKYYGNYIDGLKLKWKDVQKNMADSEAVIEFFTYEDYKTKQRQIGGVVLKKGWDAPVVLPLCQESTLEKDDFFYNEDMARLLWAPILDTIGDVRKIYFSPAGLIYQLPIESMKLNGKYLSEDYELLRISSSRILCEKYSNIGNEAYIVGGIQYQLSEKELKSSSNNKRQRIDGGLILANIKKNRSAVNQLSFLNGTKVEAENIYKEISTKNIMKAHLYMGKAAVENIIKNIKPMNVRVLHIATHGFFEPVDNSAKKKFDSNLSFDEVNNLSRSGLFMAGAQNFLNGEEIPNDADDGILTAQEISTLDLRGVDLVALSACETAKGDITSDGVLGLQRGFKKAGVNSILMSLWNVDDDATCRLMTEFYANWLGKKMSKHSALEAAKQTVRLTHGWENPKYWSAFILLDGLD